MYKIITCYTTKSVTLSVSYGPNGRQYHIKQHNNHQYYHHKNNNLFT